MDSDMLLYVQYLMISSGTFPVELIHSHQRFYKLYQYLVQASLFTFLIFIWAAPTDFQGATEELPKVINDIFLFSVVYLKGLICMTKSMGKLITDLMGHERSLMENTNEKILAVYKNTVNKSKMIQILYISVIYVAAFSFVIPHFINYKFALNQAANSTTTHHKSTIYYWWLPYDGNKHYLTTLSLQTYCALLASNYFCFIQIILIILPLNIILRLKTLGIKLRSINDIAIDGKDKMDIVENMVKICVEEHIDVIRSCVSLKSTVTYLMMLDFIMTSAQISLGLFQFISTTESGMKMFSVIYVLQTVIQLLVTYWHCDQIRGESVAIADVVYELKWYEYKKSITSTLRIMIMRSQKPLSLTVGPLGDVSLEVAVKIIKTAYTYVTFMQQIYGKE